MHNLHSIAGRPICKVPQENEDMTMRSTDSRNSPSPARRLWDVFVTARTYQARQLLKNRGN